MDSAAPFIRIALYIAVGWLMGHGLPEPIADIITNDPAVVSVISEILAGLIVAATLLWWRVAKRLGWST